MRDPIYDYIQTNPVQTGMILGSGLGDVASEIEAEVVLPYEDIPGFPRSTVEGHAGKFILGLWHGYRVLAAKGRFHYYEGYEIDKVLSIVNYFNNSGIKDVVVTNAAGLINVNYKTGAIIRLDNFIDITHKAHEAGDVALSAIRDHEKEAVVKAQELCNVDVGNGTYAWTTGPSYETPAEIRYFKTLGADVVGMSTMPEVIRARAYGLNVYPFSCATNYAAGILSQPLNHEEVTEMAIQVSGNMKSLISSLLEIINK